MRTKDPIEFAKQLADLLYEMRSESESLYENEEIPKEFINSVIDAPIHIEVMKRAMEADILWEIGLEPERFKNSAGEYEYEYWMYDYAFAMDSHAERTWAIQSGKSDADRVKLQTSISFNTKPPEGKKAYLVNVDLMVRVIVPEGAGENEIREAATNKAVNYATDTQHGNNRSWIGEGVAAITEDRECPYDPDNDTVEYIALQNQT